MCAVDCTLDSRANSEMLSCSGCLYRVVTVVTVSLPVSSRERSKRSRRVEFNQTQPTTTSDVKYFIFFSVNVPKFGSLNTKPYNRSVYFKRLHFPKLLRPTIQRRGKNTTEGGKRGRHILQDKKNIQETIFFHTAVQNIYNWVFLKKKREKERKKHALYNSGEGGGAKEGKFVYKRGERKEGFYKRQEMRTEYQNRFINYIMILETVVTETSKHRCGEKTNKQKINSVTTKKKPGRFFRKTHRRRVSSWRVHDSERDLYVQFD